MPNQFEAQLQNFRGNFEDLIDAIQEKRIAFFVGSGISRASPTNIETAKELSGRLQEKFGAYTWWQNYFDRSRLTPEQQNRRLYGDPSDLPKLEEIAELFLNRDEFKQFIDALMEYRGWQTVPPNICHTVISELLIEEICSGVITTNQDDRIETKHREITPPRVAPNVVFHDDFLSNWRPTNNVFKVHGCLFFCPKRKYRSIWTTSQFARDRWPSGVSFAHEVLMSFGRREYKIVFVAFATHLQYLENTIGEIIHNGGNYNQFYCVSRQSFGEMMSQQDRQKFANSIQLQKERHCQMDAETFFRIARHVAFEKLLNDLCRDSAYLMGEEFKGGKSSYLRIAVTEFQRIKELVKKDVLKWDRESFQKFLQLVLLEKNGQNKYVSFKYMGDHIAKLLFMLALLRFNYSLIFCKTRYRHLFIKKKSFEASLIIINGDSRKPLQIVLQKLIDEMGKDHEMARDVKNVFVYDAVDYTVPDGVSLDSLKTGKIIETVRPTGTITNASAYNYNLLHEYQLRNILSDSTTLEEFKQKLDGLPWRT